MIRLTTNHVPRHRRCVPEESWLAIRLREAIEKQRASKRQTEPAD